MKVVTAFVFWVITSSAYTQTVEVMKTYPSALERAKTNKQPILIIIDASEKCDRCPKINIQKKITKKQLVQVFSKYSIYILRDFENEGTALLTKYNLPPRFPMFLFLSESQELIHYASGWSDEDAFFLNMDQQVADRNKKGGYSYFRDNYRKNRTDRTFLREWIEYQSSRGSLVPDSVLIDYSRTFSNDELKSLENRVYLLSKGLVLNSDLFLKLAPNANLSHIFSSMPYAERANVNTKIIQKTINEAILKKDTLLAFAGARFAERSWVDNPKRGYLSYISNMRSFYAGVSDTLNFLTKTAEIAEKFLLKDIKDSTVLRPYREMKAMELNNIAFSVCQWTQKKGWLEKARNWSKETLDIKRAPEMLDTYAQIQYKLGDKESSLDFQQQAVDEARKLGQNTMRYEATLKKIKLGTLK